MKERDIPISSGLSHGETPSRYELLSMVRKHSNLLGETTNDEQDARDVYIDSEFWHEVMDLYFIRGRVSQRREEDDLVFFVRNMSMHGYGFNDNMEGQPLFFVRRWAPKLEKLVDVHPASVDWRCSFFLNLIAHTSFTVTVAICSVQALRRYQDGEATSISPVYKVVKTVYASPSRVNFQLDHKKATETLPAYPDICFAVDDFDDTFDAVVLSETDHCFCVILNAHDGAAFPGKQIDCDSSRPLRVDNDPDKAKQSKLTLFSGFVSYQMVRESYDAEKSTFGSLLSISNVQAKADRIYMRGPGGRGQVEVAVSGIADQSLQNVSPHSPLSKRSLGLDLGTIVHAASVLAKNVYAAASSTSKSELEILPLKCCLMSISLPWDHIAHDLLFKGSPPVKL